jgi:Rrf2 family nitric oxide-sensitive transcriptional repressor
MHLDKFSDYALRILMVLAVKRPETVSVRQVAETFDVSEHHLSKVATSLAQAGYIVSRRGRAGGLSLATDPRDVSIGKVLREIKDVVPVAECFGSTNTCRILPACGLRGPLKEAQEAFFAVLDGYTLADLTAQKGKLAQLIA